MTKEPIQNESFLGVILKPVIKDAKELAEPQQAKQLTKVTQSFEQDFSSEYVSLSLLYTIFN